MKIVYDPAFLEKLKKVDIRIRKNTKERLILFSKNPHDPQLDNHPLREQYLGYRSIDITADYRAIYKERYVEGKIIAQFVMLGTHQELYTNLS